MDEILLSDVEGLLDRMFEIEHHLYDPAQGSGNLQELIVDHGEWKVDVGFNGAVTGDLAESIKIAPFDGVSVQDTNQVLVEI